MSKLLGQFSEKIGSALPTACRDEAATKAAYRFFGNSRVDESIILDGYFAARSRELRWKTRSSARQTRGLNAFGRRLFYPIYRDGTVWGPLTDAYAVYYWPKT